MPDNDPILPSSPAAQEPEAGSALGHRFKSWFGRGKKEPEPAAVTDAQTPSTPATPPGSPTVAPQPVETPVTEASTNEPDVNQNSFFSRMRSGLSRTRASLSNGLATVLIGAKEIDDELLEEIETQMLVADIGVDATRQVIQALTERVERKELTHSHALYKSLQKELAQLLLPRVSPLIIDRSKTPYVILIVGVNGVGKTTTIGKLAKRLQKQGLSVMLAAGDTFRAAAVEQLTVWGERNHVPVIAQGAGSDSASVIFDALASAKARGIDVLIADTAGRLHTKSNLMEELKKVVRVLQKQDPSAPHEVMLVVDAGTGQNALHQAQEFHQAVPLTGIAVTKLDGTAKGGMLFNIASRMEVPIRFIGVGEKIDDLRPFDADEFVAALFEKDDA